MRRRPSYLDLFDPGDPRPGTPHATLGLVPQASNPRTVTFNPDRPLLRLILLIIIIILVLCLLLLLLLLLLYPLPSTRCDDCSSATMRLLLGQGPV